MNRARELLTVGHSNHPIEVFLELLGAQAIGALADVRRFPGSRRNPQFKQDALRASLEGAGVCLVSFAAELGGRRRPRPDSPNDGWRVEAFRAYADHMASAEFAAGLRRLEELAGGRRTALLCAEAEPTRCHRRLIADALSVRGWGVCHLLGDGRLRHHQLTEFALISGTAITYPAAQTSLDG